MPEGVGYPVDYVLAAIRETISEHTYSAVIEAQKDSTSITESAFSIYQGDGGEINAELFSDISGLTFDAISTGPEKTRDERASVGLAELDTTPTDKQVIVWRPRERMSGYMYQLEIAVDLSATIDSGAPLLVLMFYSIRSREIISFGEVVTTALEDFEKHAEEGGPYAGQKIFGAIITGVYKFEPVRR